MPIIIKFAIMDKQCKILDLGNNRIISHGVSLLAESLRNNATLKMLSLHQNSVSEMGIRSLSHILSLNNSVLKWLDLESTKLTDKSVQYLAEMLKINKSITGLWLSNNRISNRGVQVLTTSLIYFNTTLKHLDLENNQSINDSCIDCLIEILKENRSLKTLYLNNCQLSATNKAKLRDLANKKQNFRLFL
jgi:Ran GTPase-activating protein (RanGAP) involved in mRNA processing and transport